MTETANYRYDAFVSYSHRDKDWVRDLFVPELEKHDLRTCIDYRDFTAGAPSLENMREAVRGSRKILLVVTEDFVSSEWTKFEVRQVLINDPNNSLRRLIPLKRDNCELPEDIHGLTYIDLTESKYNEIEWKKLLKILVKTDPDNIGQQVFASPVLAVEPASRSARKGLNALSELAKDPTVQAKIAQFRADFEISSDQIDAMGFYKDVHDCLHSLQFECYNYLVSVLPSNGSDALEDSYVWDNLANYEVAVEQKAENLNMLCGQEMHARRAGSEVIKRLQGLCRNLKELSQTLNARDRPKLENVLKSLKRGLATEPTQINARLTEAARSLPLSALLSALMRVYNVLDHAEVDKARLGEFKSGVEALQRLADELKRLIDNHDSWQAHDNEVRWIESTLNLDVADLRDRWPILKSWTEEKCRGIGQIWAVSLLECNRMLESALTEQDQPKIKRYFNQYRVRIAHCFFEVDVNLKKLCDELRTIGGPLARVLEILYGQQSN